MKIVNLNGIAHPAPLADEYDPLAPDEDATLGASIAVRGVIDPVHTYDSPVHGIALGDGVNRCRWAEAHGKPVPVVHLGVMTEDEARAFLDEKHLGRRNLSPAKQQERRAARVQRVAEKRAEGKSIPVIAEEEGVSVGQVQRDIAKAKKGGGLSPDNPPQVRGRDGKTQPTAGNTGRPKKPKPAQEPKPAPTPDATPVSGRTHPSGNASDVQEGTGEQVEPELPAKPRALVDGNGRPVPPLLRDTFFDTELGETIAELARLHAALDARYQRVLRSLSQKPYKFCDFGGLMNDLKDVVAPKSGLLTKAIDRLRSGVPFAVCPQCGGGSGKGCKACRFGGCVPQWRAAELAGGAA